MAEPTSPAGSFPPLADDPFGQTELPPPEQPRVDPPTTTDTQPPKKTKRRHRAETSRVDEAETAGSKAGDGSDATPNKSDGWGLMPMQEQDQEGGVSEKLLAAVLVLALLLGFGVVVMKKFRAAQNGTLEIADAAADQTTDPAANGQSSDPFGTPPAAETPITTPDPSDQLATSEPTPAAPQGPTVAAAAEPTDPDPFDAFAAESAEPSARVRPMAAAAVANNGWAESPVPASETIGLALDEPSIEPADTRMANVPAATEAPTKQTAADLFAAAAETDAIGWGEPPAVEVAATDQRPASDPVPAFDDWNVTEAAPTPATPQGDPLGFADPLAAAPTSTEPDPNASVPSSSAAEEPVGFAIDLGEPIETGSQAMPDPPMQTTAEPMLVEVGGADRFEAVEQFESVEQFEPADRADRFEPVEQFAAADAFDQTPQPAGNGFDLPPDGWSQPIDTTAAAAAPIDLTPVPTQSVEPAAEAAPVRQVAAIGGGRMHTLAPGENFWTISKEHYGTVRYFGALAFHNRSRVPDDRKMRPGLEVELPSREVLDDILARFGGTATPAAALSAAQSLPDRPSPVRTVSAEVVSPVDRGFFLATDGSPRYRVGPSETLSGIAHDTLGRATRWRQIAAMNRDVMPNPDRIKPGVVLRLPHDAITVRTAGRDE